jgi:hypothetical protein
MHFPKFGALERFDKNISPHVFSRTVMKVQVAGIIIVFYEEIFGFDMFGSFRAGDSAILFKG